MNGWMDGWREGGREGGREEEQESNRKVGKKEKGVEESHGKRAIEPSVLQQVCEFISVKVDLAQTSGNRE